MACEAAPGIRVPAGPYAPARLRHALERDLEGQLGEPRLGVVRLLTCELDLTAAFSRRGVG